MRARALSFAATAAVGIACVWACLPNLVITPPPPPGPYCGDGIITPDAGETCDPGPDASLLANQACQECNVVCNIGQAFLDPVSSHCYFSTASDNGIDAAGGRCETNGAHVVRFASESEVSLVAHYAGTTYWVGLEDLAPGDGMWTPTEPTIEPGWTAACPGCFAHIDAGATDIPSPPKLGGVHCVAGELAGSDGGVPSWTQSNCMDRRLSLCEREPLGTRSVPCPQGACFTVAATESAKRYVLLGPGDAGSARRTADAAAASCAALGGRLVVFASREEREQVGYEIGIETVIPHASDFWLGLSSGSPGAWAWDDDAGGLAPLPWGVGQPAAASPPGRAYVVVEAGAIDSELARAQASVSETHYAVCEIP